MRRPQELIKWHHSPKPIPTAEENPGIARKTMWIARDIGDNGNFACRQMYSLRSSSATWRVKNHGIYAIKVIEKSGGSAYAVPESDIVEGIKLLAETEGIFTETAGGVTVSGLKHLAKSGAIKPDELTVVYITGNGLKTQEAVERVVNPLSIKPTIGSFESVFEGAK